MKCPFCGLNNDGVIDSREAGDGSFVRRRRECISCQRRFTSYERIDEIPYMVIKKDGRREAFDRHKILAGLLRACEKRPISTVKCEQIADYVEQVVMSSRDKECPTKKIGEIIMGRLKETDKVAYVRFASVYLEFNDTSDFMDELKRLIIKRTDI